MPDDKFFEPIPATMSSEKYATQYAELLLRKQDDEHNAFLDRLIDRAQELQRRDRENVEYLTTKVDKLERQLQEQKKVAEHADKLFQERDATIAYLLTAAGVQSVGMLRDYLVDIKKLKYENTRLRRVCANARMRTQATLDEMNSENNPHEREESP